MTATINSKPFFQGCFRPAANRLAGFGIAAREIPIRAAISNSFAFGGLNAVLAMKRKGAQRDR